MQSNRWSTAATSGILLALVTIISFLVQSVLQPGKVINLAIWAIKAVGSIWLLLYFIKEYAKPFDLFTYKDGFRYGLLVAFFSSLLCASYLFLQYTVIFPESFATQMDQVMEAMLATNPDAADGLEKIGPRLPQLIFVFTLIYYTIIGAIASAIIANYTKKGSIFDESTNL
ncbi:MAG: DUF4199 domain-containing protein [Bacteroidales bacterium]